MLVDLGAEARSAQQVLAPFLRGGEDPRVLTAPFQPLAEDYGRVFRPELAARLRGTYERIWATHPAITRKAHQTVLLVHASLAEGFMLGNPMMAAFPGGYAGLAPVLVEGVVWACWKFVAPGERLGMAWDGLVHLDERWVWFPKPWVFVRGG